MLFRSVSQSRYDLYFPAFANLGEQAVLSKEIYCTGDVADGNAILIPKVDADEAMDAASCIGCVQLTVYYNRIYFCCIFSLSYKWFKCCYHRFKGHLYIIFMIKE